MKSIYRHFFTHLFYISLFSLFFFPKKSFSQGLDIPFLFKTGFRTQASFTPIQGEDNFNMNITHYQLQGIFSLKSRVEADVDLLKLKFDVGLKQNFFTFNTGLRVVQSDFFPEKNTNYWGNLTLGYTSIKAGLKNGIWVRTIQAGAVQDVDDLENARPFVLGAIAKVFVMGLRKQNIFGLGVAYTPQGKIFPVPIIGFNRRISEKWDMNLLIPANIAFIWKPNNKFRFRFRVNPNALQVGSKNLPIFQNPNQNLQFTQSNRMQFTTLELNLGIQYQLSKNIRMIAQAGCLFGSNINFRENNTKLGEVKLRDNFIPQITAGFHFNLKDGLFGSQMFMAD